jgi:cell division protein FtsZ
LIAVPGLINLDFADVRTIMTERGSALMGIGSANGENRAADAAKKAICSPLLETSIEGARGVLMNITGGTNLSLYEVYEAADIVTQASHSEVNMIFGAVINEDLKDEILVTVIATGFDHEEQEKKSVKPQSQGKPSFGGREDNNLNPFQRLQKDPAPKKPDEESIMDPYGNLEVPTFLRNRKNK